MDTNISDNAMRHIVSTLLLLFNVLLVSAQSYTHIGVKQGLSNPKVYSIQKDNKGYMWFLTNDGVDRYNGKDMKTYRLYDEEEDIKSTYNMNWLQKDSQGTIWEIGRKGRVFQYDKNTDRFKLLFKVPPTQTKGQYSSLISECIIDPQDNIWLCRDTTDIFLYHIPTGSVSKIENIFKEVITCIAPVSTDRFYISTEKTIHEAVFRDGRLVPVANDTFRKIRAQINQLYYDALNQKLYIGTFRRGFYIYQEKDKSLITPEKNIHDISVTKILPFNSDELLIATDGAGVFKMNLHTFHLESYVSSQQDHHNETNGNCILDLYIDDESRIWMANYPYDVTVRHNKYSYHRLIRHSIGNKQSLTNDNVNAILEDHNGDLWFATNDGISLYQVATKRWKSFLNSSDQKGPKNRIFLTLCEPLPGIIWSGGYCSGIYQINKNTGETLILEQKEYGRDDIKLDKYIRVITQSSDGKVWAGGYFNLKRLDPVHKTLELFPGLNSITDIVEHDESHIWIGTANGLYQLYTQTGVYRQLVLPVEDSYINCLYQSTDRKLYIGTDGSGLLIYDLNEHSFTSYKSSNSNLISNNINAILAKANGSILLSTDKGISSFSPQKKEFTNWTKEQGLMVSHFNPSSAIAIQNKYYLFGGSDGIIGFDESLTIPKHYSTKMVLSDFQLSYQKVYPGQKGSPLKVDIDETEDLVLKGTQNIFSLKVSSINFDYPSDILYSWRLLGFYDEWSEPNAENTIQFTNLNPGSYKLQIRAVSNENWERVFETREISIRVKQPWWLSFGAILIYLLAIAGIFYTVMRMMILRKQKKESNHKINFFINTAHDIRTPLTLVKVPLEELKEKEQLSESGMENAETALKNVNILLGMTNNLLNFEQAHDYAKQLKLYKFELNSYMSDMCALFRIYANVKSIKLLLETNFDSCYVWFDKDKMDSIVKNLLSNAMKYTNEKGTIRVILTDTEKSWTLEVVDNGIGIPEKEQKNLFKLHIRGSNAINSKITGSGIGLILVSKLVRLHRGNIEVKSVLNEGSSFKVTFPKEDKKLEPYRIYDYDPEMEKSSTTPFQTLIKRETKETFRLHENADRLLVVEDNDELRNYLQSTLSDTYIVQTATNGKEAQAIVNEFKPDLILSDIMMPEMRGDEMCRLLKNDIETSHIPIILLTALNDEQQMLTSLEHGADDFVVKPFRTSVLKAKISNMLQNRKRLKEKYANLEINDKPAETEAPHYVSNDLDREFITRVKTLVEENMSQPTFNVDTLCAQMHMSRTSFYNKIKALTDQAPADYIRVIKLKKAAELLKSNKHSITEIAEMTGFNDAKYFREVFKKYFKMSPSQYIKEKNNQKP